MRAETRSHSANCADDRRESSGAALGPVLDMSVVVLAHRQFPLVQTVQNSVKVPHSLFDMMIDVLFVVVDAKAILMVRTVAVH